MIGKMVLARASSVIRNSAAAELAQLMGNVTAFYVARNRCRTDVELNVFALASAITAVATERVHCLDALSMHAPEIFPAASESVDVPFIKELISNCHGVMQYGDHFVLLGGGRGDAEIDAAIVWALLEISGQVAPALDVWIDETVHGDLKVEQVLNRATDGSAAYDVITPVNLVLTRESQLVDLGFATAIPKSKAAILLPRSGLGAKHGMALANTVGLIDSDFRDNWMAKLWLNESCGKTELTIPAGERLCQFVLIDHTASPLNQVAAREELGVTDRKGGFGSSNLVMK